MPAKPEDFSDSRIPKARESTAEAAKDIQNATFGELLKLTNDIDELLEKVGTLRSNLEELIRLIQTKPE